MPDQDKNKKSKKSKVPRTLAPNTAGIPRFDYMNLPSLSDQEVLDWTKNYISSPKYRQRLSKFYTDPNQVIEQRTKRVNDIEIVNYNDPTGESGSVYHQDSNMVIMNDNDPFKLRTTRDDILAHEVSHSINYNSSNKNLGLSPEEENYIFDREKTYGYTNDYMIQNPGKKSLGQSYKDAAKSRDIGVSQMLFSINPGLHDVEPVELKSDIDAFRFQLNKAGLYDAGTQDINQETLDKAKKDVRLYNLFNFKRLQEHFNDKDLIDIMNNIAMNTNQNIPMAQDGITVTTDDNGKKRLTSAQIKKKYSNPYVTAGREQWGEYLENKTLPYTNRPVRDVIYEASRSTGLSPQLLYTSSMEEGLREGIDDPGVTSEAYGVAVGWDINPKTKKKQQASFNPNEFPVDGFRTYGLDTFGDQYESLKRKGYLPKDFDKRFTKFKAINELDQEVNTAAFRTEQDALTAKAAMLRNTRENLSTFTKSKNINLTPRQQDFFNLVGYNAGEGNMRKMIESYREKGYLKDDKFLTDPNFKPASYLQPYTYAQRRLVNAEVLTNEGYFQDYNPNTTNSTSMNNGGYLTFNPKIYNDLYPNGEFTDLSMKKMMNLGGQVKKRKNPFEPYFATADFGPEKDPFAVMANDGIHIKKENRGKFTASAKRAGMGVQEFARHVLANPEDYSPTQRKRANFARNASKWKKGDSGIEIPFFPNAVSTPEDPIFYQDPLDEARTNITNFFNQNRNQVINDATLNGDPRYQQNIDPSFSQEGTDMTDQAINNANGASSRLGIAQDIMGAIPDINTGMFIQGAATIANLATRGKREAQEYARLVRNYSQQGVYNPRRYGTGSQAIFNNGGKVKAISTNQFGSPTLQFDGPSHENGGMDIVYANQGVEVEGGETAFIDNQNNFNVFGNMYVPGTNQKFKSISKRIAKLENKHQRDLDSGVELVNNNDPISKYGKFSFNSGKVMMASNARTLEDLEGAKSNLADLQNQMLEDGFDEKSSMDLKMKFGGKIKYDPNSYQNGGRKKGSKKSPVPSYPGRAELTGPSPNFRVQTPEIPSFTTSARIEDLTDFNIPVTMQRAQDSSVNSTNNSNRNSNTSSSTRTRGSGNTSLFPQILPEILTIATERPEFVPGQTYNPNLFQPYQVSFQDQLNQNNASFRAISQQVGNNPEALSQLAAQKYQADQNILANEFRTNQAIENQIVNQNIDLLNQSQMTNIGLADQQFVRQAQARSNTRENIRNAINSISSKASQRRLEDMTYNVYANMFPHYTYDSEGNLIFQRGESDPMFTSGITGVNSGNDYTTTRVTKDSRGYTRSTTSTPSKAQQEKLDLQNDKARRSRLSLMQKLFK